MSDENKTPDNNTENNGEELIFRTADGTIADDGDETTDEEQS